MRACEIDKALDSLKIIVDTREQPTERFMKRMNSLGCPYERRKLDFGDYSAEYTDENGNVQNLFNICAIERKMNLDELANCFCTGRGRFIREFERAKEKNCNICLLVENSSYENLLAGKYRSKLNPQSFIASILTFEYRYNLKIVFCKSELTGKMIYLTLKYALREYLLNSESENINE